MGGWQNLQALGLKILRTRAAQAALSVSGHVLVLGGLLLANPWRPAPVTPEPPLIVDLVTFTVAEEKEKKAREDVFHESTRIDALDEFLWKRRQEKGRKRRKRRT